MTREEEELSASFDSLTEDALDVHLFEAISIDNDETDERTYYSKPSRGYSPRAAVPSPFRQQLRTIIGRSNNPPPRGKTIKALRYYRILLIRSESFRSRINKSRCLYTYTTLSLIFFLRHFEFYFIFQGESVGRAQRNLLHFPVRQSVLFTIFATLFTRLLDAVYS